MTHRVAGFSEGYRPGHGGGHSRFLKEARQERLSIAGRCAVASRVRCQGFDEDGVADVFHGARVTKQTIPYERYRGRVPPVARSGGGPALDEGAQAGFELLLGGEGVPRHEGGQQVGVGLVRHAGHG